MSDNQQLAKREDTAIQTKARDLASRLKFMIANGNKLEDKEVYALAQYSAANDLNPFAQECYYLPGIGPCPGIVGWRKKAQEQLIWEAEKAGVNGAHFWIESRDAQPGEAVFDPSKDIAVIVTLRDWLSSSRWRHEVFETARQLKEFGSKDPMQEAKDFVGPEPVWTGAGVVYGSENFGARDKFDRRERAAKRAEKIALRKRFPRVNLPEPIGAEVDFVDASFSEEQTRPTHTESENMRALGFDVDPEPAQTATPQTAPAAPTAYDLSCDVTGSDGKRYGDLTDDDLSGKSIGLGKLLSTGMVGGKPITEDRRAEAQAKVNAIKIILDWRNEMAIARMNGQTEEG